MGQPTDEDLRDQLNEKIKDGKISRAVRSWMREFDNRAEPLSRVFEILNKWLHDSPSMERYQFCAFAIRGWGSRGHLSILENIDLETDSDRVDEIYQETQFGVFVRTL